MSDPLETPRFGPGEWTMPMATPMSMSLRDWFAGQALVGLWAASRSVRPFTEVAAEAYASADHMMIVRTTDTIPGQIERERDALREALLWLSDAGRYDVTVTSVARAALGGQAMMYDADREWEAKEYQDRITVLEHERDELREALIKARQFIENGIELGFINLPEDKGDPSHDTLPAIRTALEAKP